MLLTIMNESLQAMLLLCSKHSKEVNCDKHIHAVQQFPLNDIFLPGRRGTLMRLRSKQTSQFPQSQTVFMRIHNSFLKATESADNCLRQHWSAQLPEGDFLSLELSTPCGGSSRLVDFISCYPAQAGLGCPCSCMQPFINMPLSKPNEVTSLPSWALFCFLVCCGFPTCNDQMYVCVSAGKITQEHTRNICYL